MSRLLAHYTTTRLGLQTRQEEDIENEYYSNCSPAYNTFWQNQAVMHRNDYGTRIQFRVDLAPGYNCHGLTFASRRTTIWRADEVRKILAHDGYQRIDPKEILPGDIIL